MLTGNGGNTTSVKVRFGAGSHILSAFLPNNSYNTNAIYSPSTVLTVLPPRTPYSTTTSVTAAGAPGNYSLTATTLGEGLAAPSGSISFEDASTANSVIGTSAFSSRTGYFPLGTFGGAIVDGASAIAVGDFNNDGYPDLAIDNYTDDTVSVYLSNGNGTFGNALTFSVANQPIAIAAGDPLGTGNLGLMVASRSPQQIERSEEHTSELQSPC